MSETIKKRRRWLWGVVTACLALPLAAAVAPVVWRLRPLNSTEQLLVGQWGSDSRALAYDFRDDRQFSSYPVRGYWSASSGVVVLQVDPFDSKGQSFRQRFETYHRRVVTRHQFAIQFDGPDRLSFGPLKLHRIREVVPAR